MANSACIKRVADIVLSDKTIGYVVVSAPGKREKNDTNVTDLLYASPFGLFANALKISCASLESTWI